MEQSDDKEKKENKKLSGMKGFTVVWAGQLASLLGSSLTNFGILIWIWLETGQATPFAIYGFAFNAPLIIATPLAGALVDRWNRKLTIAISDFAAGLSTVVILILYSMNGLELWHLYVTGAFAGTFGAFQPPAFSAAITMMLNKKDYARASGMRSMTQTAPLIIAPIIAPILLVTIGLRAILIIDIITFTTAILLLSLIHIPPPTISKEGLESVGSIWKESFYGFKYIFNKKSLFIMMLVFLVVNLALSFSNILRAPMILARTNNNEFILGGAQSAAGIGGLVGGLFLSFWGGPKDKIKTVFLGIGFIGAGTMLMGLSEGIIIWGIAGFVSLFSAIIANGASQAFWQSKVPPDIQGKVFSARGMLAWIAIPIAMIIAGPLADIIFEPSMTQNGLLSNIFGWLIGTENGTGMSLMFVFSGLVVIIVSIIGYSLQYVREADTLLPDHDATD